MPDKPGNPNIWIVFDEAEQKWEVRRQDTDRLLSAHDKKEDAIREGRKIARREHGDLTITREDQEIVDHDSFAESPESDIKLVKPGETLVKPEVPSVKPDKTSDSGATHDPLSLDEPLRDATDRSDEPLAPGSLGLPGEPHKR